MAQGPCGEGWDDWWSGWAFVQCSGLGGGATQLCARRTHRSARRPTSAPLRSAAPGSLISPFLFSPLSTSAFWTSYSCLASRAGISRRRTAWRARSLTTRSWRCGTPVRFPSPHSREKYRGRKRGADEGLAAVSQVWSTCGGRRSFASAQMTPVRPQPSPKPSSCANAGLRAGAEIDRLACGRRADGGAAGRVDSGRAAGELQRRLRRPPTAPGMHLFFCCSLVQ